MPISRERNEEINNSAIRYNADKTIITDYDVTAIQKVRETVAHELGHVFLHPIPRTTRGTLDLSDQQEDEANLFRDMFIELRNHRHKIIIEKSKDGYHKPVGKYE